MVSINYMEDRKPASVSVKNISIRYASLTKTEYHTGAGYSFPVFLPKRVGGFSARNFFEPPQLLNFDY
jgi:hypothetical protein